MTIHELAQRPGKYRLCIGDYLLLDRSGAFGTERTELIEGDVIIMNAEYRPHAYVKSELAFAIRDALRAVGSPLGLIVDASVELAPNSAPLPDIVVTSEPRGEGLVPVASVALLVEVAASTIDRDLHLKAAIYAAAQVPEYWVADVGARVIHMLWSPEGETYRERLEIAFGEQVSAATLVGVAVKTDAL